jgi:hypothetical protein
MSHVTSCHDGLESIEEPGATALLDLAVHEDTCTWFLAEGAMLQHRDILMVVNEGDSEGRTEAIGSRSDKCKQVQVAPTPCRCSDRNHDSSFSKPNDIHRGPARGRDIIIIVVIFQKVA